MLKRSAIAVGISILLGSGWAIAQGPGTEKKDARSGERHHDDGARKNHPEGDSGLHLDPFRAVDTDDDGTISRAELNAFFDKADVDKDGTVSRRELHRAVIGAWVDRIEKMDKNHDGIITRDEWHGPKELFDKIDPDGDGSMTRDELRKGLERMAEEEGPGGRHRDGDRHPRERGERKEGTEKHESKGVEKPND